MTLIVCVFIVYSASFEFIALQITTTLLASLLILNVIFEVVMEPPFCAKYVFELVLLNSIPPTVHLISAGGLELSVAHVIVTLSLALASVGPAIVTVAGRTVKYKHGYLVKRNELYG